jgi:hypothetical protein
MTTIERIGSAALTLCLALPGALGPTASSWAQEDDEALGFERTPPRLSLVDGEVSFWRNGATDWAPARTNTPLAAGDELYAGGDSNLEVQIGARAYARAGEETQLGITNLEPDYLQVRVTRGTASLDLRSLPAAHTIELDTPNAAFTIERSGYYRVEVDEEETRFSSRRGGYASVTTANGESASIAPSEQVVIRGTDDTTLETYAAPELDGWDRWNYARTDQQIDAVSSRYVPAGVYGIDDLDHHGNWRVVPTYGAVWFPQVAAGWVPYSTGEWIYDPYYGWTWVDAAPWGWAPFHYGRWVFVSGYWGWCPGPRVVRVYYAPALVAFYGGPRISIGIGTHPFGWVALGWGEPLVPWWGPAHWRRHAHWAGWGGPRIVNNVIIQNTTVVNVNHIHTHAHAGRRGAIVAVNRGDFGRRRIHDAKLARFDAHKLRPAHGAARDLKPTPVSLVGTDRRGGRPPRADFERSVVALREPRRAVVANLEQRGAVEPRERASRSGRSEVRIPSASPPARIVKREAGPRVEAVPRRPPFGQRAGEERSAPPRPPRFEGRERSTSPQARESSGGGSRAPVERERAPERSEASRAPRSARARDSERAPAPPVSRSEVRGERERGSERAVERTEPRRSSERARASEAPRDLPGEPANRVLRRSAEPPAQAPPRESAPRQAPESRGRPQRSQRSPAGGGEPPSHSGRGEGHGR